MKRNPVNPQRITAANQKRTQDRVSQYYGLIALLNTWEAADDDMQIDNHEYILKLRARVRNVKNYLLHRSDRSADL